MQLTLIDQAILVHVDEFDRILNGKNVVVALAVDLVDHGRQRGGLARSCGTGNQHQAARFVAEFAHHRRQAELVKGLDLKGDQTKDGSGRAALIEHVGAEAGQALQTEREVEFEAFLETVLLRIGHDAVGQLLGFGRRHLRQIERIQMAVYANLRRRIGSDVEIAAGHLQHSFEQIA